MTENSTIVGRKSSRLTSAMRLCILASSAAIMLINFYQDSNVFPLFHPPAKGSSSISFEESNNTRPKKMLPDMLIVDTTKFDPKSCISRYDSLKYRKPSPYNPSSYLIAKVREYEYLHTQCGPNTESYKAAIKELGMYRNHANISNPCKYVVWKPAFGLGNRMLSLVSAFLYGLLTDRVLLLEYNKDAMNRLYCEPFPNSTWLLQEDFQQIIHPENDQERNENILTFENLVKSSSTIMDENSGPLIVHVDLRYEWSQGNLDIFHCDSSPDLLHRVPALIIESDRYFVPSLYMMSSFQNELSKLFPEKDAIFNLLGNYLFQPSNEAWETITAYYQANLEQADQKVGLQIRVFHPQETPTKTVLDEILSCTWEHNLLPKIETIINTTRQCSLKSKSQSESESERMLNKAILVASLYSIYGESLKDMYRNSSNNFGQVIEVYQPSHEEHQEYNNQEHDFKAWVEIYLLSLCDVLVTSWGSTFGYVAHSLGAMKSTWILDNFSEAQNISKPSCRRALSMEPCFHYPPKVECGTNTSSINITTVFPYIRPCEDDRGVKLVSTF